MVRITSGGFGDMKAVGEVRESILWASSRLISEGLAGVLTLLFSLAAIFLAGSTASSDARTSLKNGKG